MTHYLCYELILYNILTGAPFREGFDNLKSRAYKTEADRRAAVHGLTTNMVYYYYSYYALFYYYTCRDSRTEILGDGEFYVLVPRFSETEADNNGGVNTRLTTSRIRILYIQCYIPCYSIA